MLEIKPQGYLLSNYNGYKCVVAVDLTYQTLLSQVILGQTFMRNYYVSVEYGVDGTRIKLADATFLPNSTELSGGMKSVFLTAQLIILIGLGIPILYSLKQFTKKSIG